MEINVSLISLISLEEFRGLVPDLEILARKKIPHDKGLIKRLRGFEITERKIYADGKRRYRVEDYASGRDGSEIKTKICVGSAYFCHKDLES